MIVTDAEHLPQLLEATGELLVAANAILSVLELADWSGLDPEAAAEHDRAYTALALALDRSRAAWLRVMAS